MSALQKKILGIIMDKITEHGFEAINKAQWANTGDVHVTLPGKFGTLAKVDYDFQDSNLSLAIYKTVDGRAVGVPSQPGRPDYFNHYMKYEEENDFEVFMRHLGETLDQIGPAGEKRTGDCPFPGCTGSNGSHSVGCINRKSGSPLPMPRGNLFLVRSLEYDDDGDPYYTGVVRAKDMESAHKLVRKELGKIMDEPGEKLPIRIYPLDDVEEGILPTAKPGFQDFPRRKGKRT
jgi:hypothetical protein